MPPANDNKPNTQPKMLIGVLLGFWLGVVLSYFPRLV
jgi:uncharacterized protein involved in exopolysaccharide biosynthesis